MCSEKNVINQKKKLNFFDKDLTGNKNRVFTNHLNTVKRKTRKRKRVLFTTSSGPFSSLELFYLFNVIKLKLKNWKKNKEQKKILKSFKCFHACKKKKFSIIIKKKNYLNSCCRSFRYFLLTNFDLLC